MEQKEEQTKKLKKEIATLEKVQNTLQDRKDNVKYMQIQLEKKLEELEEELEDKTEFKNYLEGFDKVFETHTAKRIKETPLLLELFNKFNDEIYQTTELQNKIVRIKKQIRQEMEKTFTDEQLYLVKQYQYLDDRICDDLVEQAFIFGYAINSELRTEIDNKYQLPK